MKNVHITAVFACIFLLLGAGLNVSAQEKSMVQLKAFDQQMNPMQNISLSINGKEFIPIQNKKATFYELLKEDLPPKFIGVDKKDLEAESWSYSKGTLEVIIRKKSYSLLDVYVESKDKKPLSNVALTFKGRKTINATTNSIGNAQLPLALDDRATQADQFAIAGYRITKMVTTEKGRLLTAEVIPQKKEIETDEAKSDFLADFDLSQLDSIRSLTVFYAVFKNYDISAQEESVKQRIDAKFKELMGQLQKPEDKLQSKRFIAKISDSSFVRNDVKSLLDQAKFENELLDNFRNDFDTKIKIISQKISAGTSTLDGAQREKLIEDLDLLETVLRQNEDKFYKNISDYRIILSSLKSSFSDIKKLETKLSIVEAKRLEEQRAFRNKIVIATSVTLTFGVLLIFLIALRGRLKKQQSNLIKANDQIKRMNENLEVVVLERTRLLMDAHHEMDIFLYRASHDLRAPICTIMGLCNIALHNDGSSHELVHKIADTAFKMDGMLRKLRMISEINQPSNYSTIRLVDKINYVVSYFSKFIADNKIDVEIDCDPDLDFNSYPDLIEIILYNLIDNALFFSTINKNRQAKIAVKAGLTRDHLFLSIYDNGIGIDEQVRIKLWDMFFVGHEYSKGNGLGLYIVFKSIQALKGKIDVETERNIYTKFIINIPVNTSETSSLKRIKDQHMLVQSN